MVLATVPEQVRCLCAPFCVARSCRGSPWLHHIVSEWLAMQQDGKGSLASDSFSSSASDDGPTARGADAHDTVAAAAAAAAPCSAVAAAPMASQCIAAEAPAGDRSPAAAGPAAGSAPLNERQEAVFAGRPYDADKYGSGRPPCQQERLETLDAIKASHIGGSMIDADIGTRGCCLKDGAVHQPAAWRQPPTGHMRRSHTCSPLALKAGSRWHPIRQELGCGCAHEVVSVVCAQPRCWIWRCRYSLSTGR